MSFDKKVSNIYKDGLPGEFVFRVYSTATPPTSELSGNVVGSVGSDVSTVVGVSTSSITPLKLFLSSSDGGDVNDGLNYAIIEPGDLTGYVKINKALAGNVYVSGLGVSSGSVYYNKNFHSNNFKPSYEPDITLSVSDIVSNSEKLIWKSTYYYENVVGPTTMFPGYPTSKKVYIPSGYEAPPSGKALLNVVDYSGTAADNAQSSQIAYIPKTAYVYPKNSTSVYNNQAARIEVDHSATSSLDELGRSTLYPDETFRYEATTSAVMFSVYVRHLGGDNFIISDDDGNTSVSSGKYFALGIGSAGLSGIVQQDIDKIISPYTQKLDDYKIASFEWDDNDRLVCLGASSYGIFKSTQGTGLLETSDAGVLSGTSDDLTKFGMPVIDKYAGNGWYRAYISAKVPNNLKPGSVYSPYTLDGLGAIHTRFIAPAIGGHHDFSLPGLSGVDESSYTIPTAVSGQNFCFAQYEEFSDGGGFTATYPRPYQSRANSQEVPEGGIFYNSNAAKNAVRFTIS